VLLDDVQFVHRGWIHRNKILDKSGRELEVSIPNFGSSSRSFIGEIRIHENFSRKKILEKIKRCYGNAKYFTEAIEVVEPLLKFETNSLVEYLENSLIGLTHHLEIQTSFVRSSRLELGHCETSSGRMIQICKKLGISSYLNLPGGKSLYSPPLFQSEGISLSFLSPDLIKYTQFDEKFNSPLSILDNLMHAGLKSTAEMVNRGSVELGG
jgi:hypothetical protein